MATLGERIATRDARTFVGRQAELERLASGDANVVLLHGPGGIGKSRLLRELGRRSRLAGRSVLAVDGRQISADPSAIARVLSRLPLGPSPMVLFDNWDRVAALAGWLRSEVLPTLPEGATFVLAGRERPDPAWFTDGWEGVTTDIELRRMPDVDAAELVRALGVSDGRLVLTLVEWAQGWPLALALATETRVSGGPIGPDVMGRLASLVVDEEVDGVHRGELAVASIARVTTVDLLKAVLPGADPIEAYDWLSSRSFTEPIGRGLTVHDLVQQVLLDRLHHRSPDLYMNIRRRIIDHLYERARWEGTSLILELAHLVENPVIRWGFGESTGDRWFSTLGPADFDEIEAACIERGSTAEWGLVRQFLDRAPEKGFVIRDQSGMACGVAVAVTPGSADQSARADPVLGGWLAHADANAPDGNAVLWHTAMVLMPDPGGRVQGLLGSGGILRSGLHNPRFFYLPIDPRLPDAVAFATTIGAVHTADLDVSIGEVVVHCYVVDFGPEGLLGALRALLFAEMGLPPDSPQSTNSVNPDDVRSALHLLHEPAELASCALAARLAEDAKGAGDIAALLRQAASDAFGVSERDRLRRELINLAFVEVNGNHASAAAALHLSRATYFRRLREATDRMAVWLTAAMTKPAS